MRGKVERFRVIDHTADMGIRVYGKDLKELFANSAYGMASLMTDLDKVAPKECQEVVLERDNKEELLVSWLNELLYLFSSRNMLFSKFEIAEIDERHLRGKVWGEQFDPQKHKIETEIKAATYHNLNISRLEKETPSLSEGLFQAEIIFDV